MQRQHIRPLAPPRDPLPDLVELLRQGFEGMALPVPGLDRWFDRMEAAR